MNRNRGEILTLQFGKTSNFVGAHFWNSQDELLSLNSSHVYGNTVDNVEQHQYELFETGNESDNNGSGRQSCPEILYRVGRHNVAPRTVMIDFKNAIGGINSFNSLIGQQSMLTCSTQSLISQASDTWSGTVDVHRQLEVSKIEFQSRLEDGATQMSNATPLGEGDVYGGESLSKRNVATSNFESRNSGKAVTVDHTNDLWNTKRVEESHIRGWGDFLRAKLLPQSMNLLHQYGDQDNSRFVAGYDIMGRGTKELDDVMESIRFFLEECNGLQGVQAIVDVNSGFGSMAQTVLEEFSDDVKNCSIFVTGIVEPCKSTAGKASRLKVVRDMNEAMAMATLTEAGSLYLPMPLYSLKNAISRISFFDKNEFDPSSLFQTTSLAAIGFDNISMPYRFGTSNYDSNNAVSFRELIARLAPQKDALVAHLSLELPFTFPKVNDAGMDRILRRWPSLQSVKPPLNISFASDEIKLRPKYDNEYNTFGGSLVLRGISVHENETLASRNECLARYVNRLPSSVSPSILHSCFVVPLPITLASPNYWNNPLLGPSGESSLSPSEVQRQQKLGLARSVPPVSLPVVSYLENSTRSGSSVFKAYDTMNKLPISRQFDSQGRCSGLEREDMEVLESQLSQLNEVYCEGLNKENI